MRFITSKTSLALVLGPIRNKSLELEAGVGPDGGVSVGAKFDSRGDHAGVRCWLDVWRVYFGATLHDTRHWNYEKNRFYEPGEEQQFTGYPHE